MIAATYAPPNLGNFTTPPTRYHKCRPGGSETFAITATPVDTVTAAGSVTTSVFKDVNVEQQTGASTRTDHIVGVDRIAPPVVSNKSVTFESGNTAIVATPDGGVAQGVANGTTTITARAADGEVSSRQVYVDIKTGASAARWTSGVSGSLLKHCTDQIESRIAGKDRASMDIWSSRDNSTGVYQWNPNCWGADLANITCLSPWNSATGNGGGGVLITPRHVLYCHHLGYYPGMGSKVRYVRPDNVTEEFTVTQVTAHPYTAGWVVALHDIVICKLDRDVPASIKFAKVLPPDPNPRLPTIKRNEFEYLTINGANVGDVKARSCYTSQHKRLAAGFLQRLPNQPHPDVRPGSANGSEGYYAHVRHEVGVTAANPLGDTIFVGDSGAPAFLVVNGELVVTNVWTGIGLGYAFYTDATIVNSLLDGGYQLTQVDLSGFPTYLSGL